ncbi:Imidazoleglycerol-phosphate dehydratase [Pseudovibrio sp. W64]|uniref:imidazoleglycerol-phosphate dehydratase HisB n=1 Tax=unclassified Pseudovibrio TaxID=2627060 RepID=UPI0007AEDA56|nr:MULTISPECIES: imidazoleglycerol-phosphate dehydratase HisB [unclassified Pseudovibrio]KZK87302.1 Imidazoleglycerol-phosphate dehydratase [Pseudovibrio sp. Ad13]KZK89055.1 Imidazoleglycerol-phosphate dehydratase [Pseudovibrio sp. Ad5]KZK89277.1 Imidazoleglycerol-phosphate dehydratase [Pseudovibrio sp. W64]KZK95524.1 Imidazoleglycerol-phosphate dehydratase [Pseudovibrio sp. Ad46]KZL02696.1 Imidazoleglycerol-phosphate dehydratase [Pseudovibrio sp. W74]
MRQATIARGTKETTISVSINLDGTGKYDIKTGVGFFDHMLEQLSRHSLVDMTIRADGDTHIDDHHTTEDVGIALGQAFKEALGDMSGITRYADTHLAMDEALTRVALDVSGRPFLVWQVDFPRDKVGTFDTELFEEFFRAFAMNAGFTLHIANLYGTNCHHIAETCFKAVARTVRTAIEPDPRQSGRVPTTKGQLGG